MTPPPATAALRLVLAGIPDVAPPDRIDRLWLFVPRDLGGRESGLVVLSLRDPDAPPEQRRLVTVAYETAAGAGPPRLDRTVTEQGRAPADRIPRLMQGVLDRLRDEPGEPSAEAIHFRPERWSALVERLAADAG